MPKCTVDQRVSITFSFTCACGLFQAVLLDGGNNFLNTKLTDTCSLVSVARFGTRLGLKYLTALPHPGKLTLSPAWSFSLGWK